MALFSCFASPIISSKIDSRNLVHTHHHEGRFNPRLTLSIEGSGTKSFGYQGPKLEAALNLHGSFLRGCGIINRPKVGKFNSSSKRYGVCYSWLNNSQIASSVFTLGTTAVLPFYTLMVVAPRAEITKKTMKSNIPYVVLGLLYTYLLCLSWTPDTIRMMFASKYWLPELPGIAQMFSSEMTLASAWIHLLVVDLFAARQVYHDGLENDVETRHSVSMCLLFCPVGIVSHVITKSLSSKAEVKTEHNR